MIKYEILKQGSYYLIKLDNNRVFYDVPKDIIEIINEERNKRLKAIEYIKSNPPVFYDENLIDVETLLNNECNDEYVGEIKFISKLLEILGCDE